jgi:hypothetical protein
MMTGRRNGARRFAPIRKACLDTQQGDNWLMNAPATPARRGVGVTVVATSCPNVATVPPCPVAAAGPTAAVRGNCVPRPHSTGVAPVAILSHGGLARFVRPRPAGAPMGPSAPRGDAGSTHTPIRAPRSMRSPPCCGPSAAAAIGTGRNEGTTPANPQQRYPPQIGIRHRRSADP